MRISFYILLLPLFFLSFVAAETNVPTPGKYTVYVFMGEECIISQQYTLLLKKLHQTYSSDQISFQGYFPNPSSNEDKLSKFQTTYQIPFDLELDHLQQQMDRFGVKVTPEVVVFHHDKEEVVYQGRIDNTFFRVGKRRTITTTAELEDVLKAIQSNKAVEVTNTQAIGCFITPLDSRLKNIKMCKTTDGQ